jgi:hypothetical protein
VLPLPAFRGEALRVEYVGLVPQPFVPVDDPRPDGDQVAGPNLMFAEPVLGDGFAIEARDRRVEPQRFLENRAQQRQAIRKIGAGSGS